MIWTSSAMTPAYSIYTLQSLFGLFKHVHLAYMLQLQECSISFRHSKGPHILCRNPKWLSHKYHKAFLKSLNSFLLALAQPLFQPNSKLLALPPTSRPQSATGSPRACSQLPQNPPRPTHQWASTRPKPQSHGASHSGALPHLSAVWQQP